MLACCRKEYRLTSTSCPSAKTRALPNLRARTTVLCTVYARRTAHRRSWGSVTVLSMVCAGRSAHATACCRDTLTQRRLRTRR